MPANPLRKIFSDSVADINGIVRAHLCPPQSYGSALNGPGSPNSGEGLAASKTRRPGGRGIGEISGRQNGHLRVNVGPESPGVNGKGTGGIERQDCVTDPYCRLGSCCGGRLLVLWLKSNNSPEQTTSVESSPYHKPSSGPLGLRPPLSLINRAGSVSTAYSSDDQPAPHPLHHQQSITFGGLNSARLRSDHPESDPVDPGASSGEIFGRIQFHLWYDFREMTLNLRIICATELAAKDITGTSDPYVKVMLLPDRKHKLLTNIKRKNLNPRWNETFAFEGFPYGKLTNRILYLQVLDYDRFSRDDPIGEICQPLCDVDLVRGQTFWRTLQPCKGHTGKLGEVLLSLCYQPTAESITLRILEARELKSKDINGLSDPYVKIWLLQDGKKVEKRKTAIAEKTLNPVFNEMFMFHFPYERVRNTSLVVSVMDHDRMGRNELIGQVVLGSKSGPSEVKHWNEMFSKTRKPAERWHVLRNCQ